MDCIRCGVCVEGCPIYIVTGWEIFSPRGRMILLKEQFNDDFFKKSIFTCLTCARCRILCPIGIEVYEKMEIKRRELRKTGLAPQRYYFISDSIRKFKNPFGNRYHKPDFILEHSRVKKAEVIYYPGCTSVYREKSLSKSVIDILLHLNIEFVVESEYCCGSTALRTGDSAEVAEPNYKKLQSVINETGAKAVITSCPGCFKTLKGYDELFGGLSCEVMHVSQFLSERLDELDLKKTETIATYHDSCHLGRGMGIYDEPRILINRMVDLVEMEKNREHSLCCGGGGGIRIAYKDVSNKIRKIRAEEAAKTGADMLITSCPYCYLNLKRANKIEVKDLFQLIAENILNKRLAKPIDEHDSSGKKP